MMRPHFLRIIDLIAARLSRKVEVRFTSITCCQSSSFMRMESPSRVMPALHTKISTWPSAASACCISESAASGCDRLARMVITSPPRPSATASSASLRVPVMASFAPWAFSARTMAPPIPPDAPVTSAVFPERENIILSLAIVTPVALRGPVFITRPDPATSAG